MLKKILKGLFIWSGTSWIVYGVSQNLLNYALLINDAKSGADDIPEMKFQLAIKAAFDNFKKAYELLK